MLFKPWTEQHGPRHMLDDAGDDEEPMPGLVPQVSVDYKASAETVMIVPKTLKVVVESVAGKKEVGYVRIRYPEIKEIVGKYTDDEYDEDEQLYAAIMERSLKDKYTEMDVPIYQYGDSCAMIVVPHMTNAVAINIVGAEIVAALNTVHNWIVLSPCHLNNNETINKITTGSSTHPVFESVSDLRPPHFITGICASVVASLKPLDVSLSCLALNAEGQSGFEKLDNDAIIDTSYIVQKVLQLDESYLKAVSLGVRKFNGYSNSGMYI